PVAAALLAAIRRALAYSVALDPERIGDFARLDRRVHRVRHVALNAVIARPHRPAALAAADRLDIAVGAAPRDFGARVVAADRDRVHRALARGRHTVGGELGADLQDGVGDPLCRLGIAGAGGCRVSGGEEAALRDQQ